MVGSTQKSFDSKSIFGGDPESKAKRRNNTVIDSNWIESRFMVPDSDVDADILDIRYDSIASLKFTDTSIGGNVHINPRPQFNPLTDPRAGNRVVADRPTPTMDPKQSSTGMGEGYSRLIDDNQQTVFMEFGLPKFNSLLDFFFRAVDYEDSVLANTGRPSTFYKIGKGIGTAIGLIAFPILSVTIHMGKFAATALLGDKSLKFYYFDPKMDMYWATVNTIVTQLVTEQGLLQPVFQNTGDNLSDVEKIGMPAKLTQADIDNINEIIPGKIIKPGTNYVDVFSIVTRSQRAAIKQREIVYKRMANGELDKEDALSLSLFPKTGIVDELNHYVTFGEYLGEINSFDKSSGDETPVKPPVTNNAQTSASKPKFRRDQTTGSYLIPKNKDDDSWFERFKKSFDSSIRQGGAYAVFGVDYTGSVSESFSNSTTNIELGDKAKQIASRSRALSYNLARGNMLGDNFIRKATSAVGDLLAGVAGGVSIGLTNVISSLTGNAFVEMPKRWEDSSMSFPQQTYTMQLVSPYNSFLSQLQNIYIPLCMILGGVLPLATGKSSYTSPYLCTLFSRGLQNIQLGMITSVNITRGTSTLGFDKKRKALAIDVSFSVTDFSTLITSPVNSSMFSNVFQISMEDDTPLGNYISVLGNRDIITSRYAAKRISTRLSRQLMQLEQTFSSDRIGMLLGNTLEDSLGSIVSARSLPTILKR